MTVDLWAPAKLTLRLAVTGRRPDGYHELEAEMVTLDLADRLALTPLSAGPEGAQRAEASLEVLGGPGSRAEGLMGEGDNLVLRALRLVGRRAHVRLDKRIPVQGGLGGGSADAAAVLRWAGRSDAAVATRLGADVPFCVVGGRAAVGGLGEQVTPLPFEARTFLLLVPPFGSDTAAVYRAYDELAATRPGRPAPPGDDAIHTNHLTAAALRVDQRLGVWRDHLGDATGRPPRLAGSGSTWFVELAPEEVRGTAPGPVVVEGRTGQLIVARTVPAGWSGPAS